MQQPVEQAQYLCCPMYASRAMKMDRSTFATVESALEWFVLRKWVVEVEDPRGLKAKNQKAPGIGRATLVEVLQVVQCHRLRSFRWSGIWVS